MKEVVDLSSGRFFVVRPPSEGAGVVVEMWLTDPRRLFGRAFVTPDEARSLVAAVDRAAAYVPPGPWLIEFRSGTFLQALAADRGGPRETAQRFATQEEAERWMDLHQWVPFAGGMAVLASPTATQEPHPSGENGGSPCT